MPDGAELIALSAPQLFDGEHFLHNHCALILDGHVDEVLPEDQIPDGIPRVALETGTLAPGFVDLQVNGGGDRILNASPDSKTIDIIAQAHRTKGTTSLLPTVVSDAREVHALAAEAVLQSREAGNKAILGLHIEGPFFPQDKRGAHRQDKLRDIEPEDMEWLRSLKHFPVLLTLAPEQFSREHIKALTEAGLTLCAGHTNADYESMLAATEAGVAGVTHLFNAMSPLTSRAPGVVGAALNMDSLWAGIIADGHHVHAAAIQLAFRTKPAGKLILVSDAMATVGGASPAFTLYDETITERDGKLVNAEGNLAGSAIGMIDAVRYCTTHAGIPLGDCLRMASLYPAAILELDQIIGRLAPGYRADIVHFDENFAVRNTWLAGQRQQH